jgi:hypothetical protein
MIFCQAMEDNEAIELHGPERFSKHSGYGGSFAYEGRIEDDTEV